jgi:hypothetical protein
MRMRSSFGLSRRGCLRAAAALIPLAAEPLVLLAADEYALIAGTVFGPSGHAFAGAEVAIQGAVADGRGGKPKPIKVRTSARGEFAVRLPARRQRYTVVVSAQGFRREEKTVEIQSDERVDLSFLLETGK